MNEPLALAGFELVTAVGDDARQTCASVRAGISRIAESSHFFPTTLDPGWDPDLPVRVAMAEAAGRSGFLLRERLVELARRALQPLPGQVSLRRSDLKRTALLAALPWPDAAVKKAEVLERFIPDLLLACGLPAFAVVRTLSSGHTAVFELLGEGRRLLAEGQAEALMLVAVDSFLPPDRLELLDAAWRLRSDRNVDGFFPGEAAAALFLEPLSSAKRAPLAVLGTVGRAEEPETNLITSERQSTGGALATAIRNALDGSAGDAPCPWVLCDMNGESYRSFEWGLAMARIPDRLGSVGKLSHPAESLGDVGAATGGVLIGLAATGFTRGYAPGPEALLWASSDGPVRAALRMEAGERHHERGRAAPCQPTPTST